MKWWDHAPFPVVEDDVTKILWNFNTYTDHHISARRPDIVYIDKNARIVSVIDIAVPAEHHVKDKEMEKIDKYQDLFRDSAVMEYENGCSPSCCWNFGSCIHTF